MKISRICAAALLTAVVSLLVSCKEETAVVGHKAPEIAAFDLQGNKVDLSHWKNQTVLLTFWSETCGACIAELKELEKIAQTYSGKLRLVAVNIDGEKADTAALVAKRQLTMPVIKDQMKITAERYRLSGTPTSFLIDAEGKIRYKFEGVIPRDEIIKLFSQG